MLNKNKLLKNLLLKT